MFSRLLKFPSTKSLYTSDVLSTPHPYPRAPQFPVAASGGWQHRTPTAPQNTSPTSSMASLETDGSAETLDPWRTRYSSHSNSTAGKQVAEQLGTLVSWLGLQETGIGATG